MKRGDYGASFVEYALLLAFIALCALAAVALLSGNIEFADSASSVSGSPRMLGP